MNILLRLYKTVGEINLSIRNAFLILLIIISAISVSMMFVFLLFTYDLPTSIGSFDWPLLFALVLFFSISLVFLEAIKPVLRKKNKTNDGVNFELLNTEMQEELIGPFSQYLNLFPEYVKVAKKESIQITISTTSNRINVVIHIKSDESIGKFKRFMSEYLSFAKENIDKIIISVEGDATNNEIDLLRLKLENQVNHFRTNLKIAKMENKLLRDESDFLRKLAMQLAKTDNVIHNQYIRDGHQQFASQIKNE
ncbi:MAG: hypothetical protein MI974_31335 [Chitinophagales bacterium]|nr:hypothetical protein [Chitinophagales bacterium]